MVKATLEDWVGAKSRESLAVYLGLVHQLDDGRQAIPPKHLLDKVIPALEDDSLGDTVIVAPPGSVKTNTMIGYLARYIGLHPGDHVAYVCASGPEAEQRSLAVRDTIEFSDLYKAIFPVKPNKGRGWAADSWFLERPLVMDKNPTFKAVGVGGRLKGARVSRIVYDDLSDDENAKTEGQRSGVWRFLAETGKTRLDPQRGRQVMIGTREHEDDAIGYAIDRGWHYVHIPALNELGESYWPDRFPAAYLACPNDEHATGQCCMKKELGSVGFARQFMGVVFNEETTRFRPGNWRRFDNPDDLDVTNGCITIDTAGWDQNTKGDFACIAAWVTDGTNFYCLNVQRGRWLFSEVQNRVREMQERYELKVVVEDVPWARPLIDSLQRTTWGVIPYPVKGKSKINRVDAIAPMHEAGDFWLPKEGAWVQPFIDEHAIFPYGKNDDQVDTTSMAISFLSKNTGRRRKTFANMMPFTRDWRRLSA